MAQEATNTLVPEDALPRCGAIVLDALLANDGITGIELDRDNDTLALRYDPRRTNRDHVEAVANLLQPALQQRPVQPGPHGQLRRGRLDGPSYLLPSTALQRVGRISIEADRVPVLPPQTVGPAAVPAAPDAERTDDEKATDKDNALLLKVIQPGLVGLMDGSVSTLAPLFAAAFASHNTFTAFLVGMAAAVGAAISMGFAEALSDDGVLTGRGHPWARGAITGGMTFVGGVGHALPFLIPNFHLALIIAYLVVGVELITIAFIRTKFFGARFMLSVLQVVVGGALVFAAGVLIGSA